MPDTQPTYEQLVEALRTLAAQWEKTAQDARVRGDDIRASNVHEAYYHRGLANGYASAAQDLRSLLEQPAETSEKPLEVPVTFVEVNPAAVNAMLTQAGLAIRTLYHHKDHAFTAVFPRLQAMPMNERLQRIQQIDPRIVILDSGKLPDTGEPFIDFAFEPGS